MSAINKQELDGLAAIDLIREALEPIAPDQWDGAAGDTRGWISSARLSEVVDPLLVRHGVVIELVGTSMVGGTGLRTQWRWRHEGFRSDPTVIETQVDLRSDLGATAATRAAVTSARRTYVIELLGVRQAEDHEGDLAREMDRARGVAMDACRRALKAYCRRYNTSEDRAIRMFTGITPAEGVELAVEHLQPAMVAGLWSRLLCHIPSSSVVVDFGAPVRGMDELPEALGGAA